MSLSYHPIRYVFNSRETRSSLGRAHLPTRLHGQEPLEVVDAVAAPAAQVRLVAPGAGAVGGGDAILTVISEQALHILSDTARRQQHFQACVEFVDDIKMWTSARTLR